MQTQPDSQSNEVDGTPVTTEPAEDEQSQSPAAPLHDDTQDGVEEEPDLGRQLSNFLRNVSSMYMICIVLAKGII